MNEMVKLIRENLRAAREFEEAALGLADILGRVIGTLEKQGMVDGKTGLRCIDEYTVATLQAKTKQDLTEAFMRALNRAVPVALERE